MSLLWVIISTQDVNKEVISGAKERKGLNMIELIIAGVLVAIVISCMITRMPVNHYKICVYCGRKNYLGTDTNAEFVRDHLVQYQCAKCRANLFSLEKGKE